MPAAYEVGAIFRVNDEASAVLQRIANQFRELQLQIDRTKEALTSIATTRFGGLTGRVDSLTASLGNVEKAASQSAIAMSSGFARVDEAASTSIKAVRDLRAEMAGLAATAKGVSVPLLGGGAGSGGGAPPGVRARAATGGRASGGHGPHGRLANVSAGGLGHISGGSVNPMALGVLGAIAYGVGIEAEIEDQAARMILTGQMNSDAAMGGTPQFQQIRSTLQDIVGKTGFSPKDVGEAMLGVERQFGGLPFEKRIQVEGAIAPYAAAEARLKETGLKESFEALVGLTHMTGTYDPAKLPELMRNFSYASMITPVDIGQFQKALSYSLPMLHAGLDMDPSSIMFLTAMTQTAGITNTKSGTWLRSFFENAEPRIGTAKSDLAHNEALRKMGLLDESGHVTWQRFGADGKTDWDKSIVAMSEAINKFTQAVDPATRLGILRQAFGERGGGEAALMNLTEFIKQFPVLMKAMQSFKGGDDVLGYLNENSPIQQGRQAFADFNTAMMDLGKTVMPAVVTALKDLDKGIKDSVSQVQALAQAAQPLVNAFHALAGAVQTAIGSFGGVAKLLGEGAAASPDPGAAGRRSLFQKLNPTGGLGPHSFNAIPVPGGAHHQLAGDVILDGRKVGGVMWRQANRGGEHPTQASYFDTNASYAAGDYSFATG